MYRGRIQDDVCSCWMFVVCWLNECAFIGCCAVLVTAVVVVLQLGLCKTFTALSRFAAPALQQSVLPSFAIDLHPSRLS